MAPNESSAHGKDGPDSAPIPVLLALAPELIQIIVDHVDARDIERLRLTCNTLGLLLKADVFRVLRLKLTKDTLRRDVERLRLIAALKHRRPCLKAVSVLQERDVDVHPAIYGTRTLYIGSLAPTHDPSYSGPVWKYVDGDWVAEPEDEDAAEIAFGQNALRMYLFDALVTLKAVQNVEWTPHYKESEDTQCTVMKALQILPNLRSARFTVGHCKIPLQLDALTTIQEVSLSGTCTKDIDHDATLRSLARLVGASSLLTAIGVANNWRRSQDGAQVNLHALLALRPKSAQPLHLRRLSIQCVMVRLDEVTLPHLQYLRALSLTGIEDPCHLERQAVKYGSQGLDETMLSREGYGSTSVLDEVWRALQDADIWLEELIVDAVVPALHDYLASYGGLQKLVLKPGGFEDSASSDAVAEEFYGRVLGNHATTLQDLEINALYEGKWCIAPHNLDAIALCGDLRTLRMSVGYGQVGLLSGLGGDKENDFVKLFLDTVALHLPQLDQVHIDVANLEELRAAFCGNRVIAHFAHTTRAMAECVSRYRAHDSCLRLPAKLSIGNPARQFIVAHHVGSDGEIGKGAAGRILRYVDVTPSAERHLNLDYGCW